MFSKLALLAVSATIGPALGETILGVTVFTRHGDRTSKHFPGYSLTSLGAQQNFKVGQDYRGIYLDSGSSKRILGISEDKYVSSQVYASTPDQKILLDATTAFLQGFYPPLEEVTRLTLANGSTYSNPLNGYQYIHIHSEPSTSPNSIWLKGDDSCPTYTRASSSFKSNPEFQQRTEATTPFYARFWDILRNVHDYRPENLTYANAYDIYDLLNTASIHNASFAPANHAISQGISAPDLARLRTLADSAEFAANYDVDEPMRSIGGATFAGAVLARLNETVATRGRRKFSLLAGSYDTFLSFFGLADLTAGSADFYGLPAYAASMAFEVFTAENVTAFPAVGEVSVRFLFRNGSDGEALKAFPLFGRKEVALPWSEFVAEMGKRAITSVREWCEACESTAEFCMIYSGPTTIWNPAAYAISGVISGIIGGTLRARKARKARENDICLAEMGALNKAGAVERTSSVGGESV
ncbi:hypothetical protein H2199_003036 [Coniosporium tulheliwenetii]|uniref:Uncharacterized protein n=1 Tax=Coniosporium tulheliwenetii TaxID=3383036 RepID=A0ACC2ZFF0_9PEZI|nr:hypothetical protein H2199_003036 [Cladosporium sp. JES 115]